MLKYQQPFSQITDCIFKMNLSRVLVSGVPQMEIHYLPKCKLIYYRDIHQASGKLRVNDVVVTRNVR